MDPKHIRSNDIPRKERVKTCLQTNHQKITNKEEKNNKQSKEIPCPGCNKMCLMLYEKCESCMIQK